jgi:hypothetical protein
MEDVFTVENEVTPFSARLYRFCCCEITIRSSNQNSYITKQLPQSPLEQHYRAPYDLVRFRRHIRLDRYFERK